MKFTNLVHGRLIKRYKRFLTDVRLDDGSVVTAHCTNSGSMKTCIEEGAEVYLSPAGDPKRKTPYTWEMIKINGNWIGIHTTHPNKLIYEALLNKEIPQLQQYDNIKREVQYKDSRFDIRASNEEETCYIEIKNVTMKVGDFARFPDAKTSRGLKHLYSLADAKQNGCRAMMIYVIQRVDVGRFGTAADIDPEYAKALTRAKEQGVEILALQAKVSPQEIKIDRELEVLL